MGTPGPSGAGGQGIPEAHGPRTNTEPRPQLSCCPDPPCALSHSVYSGHQSVLVPPLELESNVSLWLSAVSQYKARVTFCSYSVMEMCTKGLGAQTGVLRVSAPPCLPLKPALHPAFLHLKVLKPGAPALVLNWAPGNV